MRSLQIRPIANSISPAELQRRLVLRCGRRRQTFNLGLLRSMALALVCSIPWVAVRAATPAVPKPASLADLFPDTVLARGKGIEVTQSQVEEMYSAFKSHRAAIGQQVPEGARAQIEGEILDKLIATKLCLNRATPADREEARGIADKFVSEQIRLSPSEDSFNRQLMAVGMTPEKFRAQVLEQAIVKAVIDREVPVSQAISSDQIREFYDKNPELFQQPELVRVSHVLISTKAAEGAVPIPEDEVAKKRALALEVLAKARAGAKFADLVREYSDDEASKSRGGEYTIARASEDPGRAVVPEFEAAAFSLEVNQVSDLVTTIYGFHIVKALEKIPSRQQPLAAVSDKIGETLRQEAVQNALPAYIAKLRKEAQVEILSQSGNGR
jgi:peptidyl-prolyl cis-trans isomerase C